MYVCTRYFFTPHTPTHNTDTQPSSQLTGAKEPSSEAPHTQTNTPAYLITTHHTHTNHTAPDHTTPHHTQRTGAKEPSSEARTGTAAFLPAWASLTFFLRCSLDHSSCCTMSKSRMAITCYGRAEGGRRGGEAFGERVERGERKRGERRGW